MGRSGHKRGGLSRQRGGWESRRSPPLKDGGITQREGEAISRQRGALGFRDGLPTRGVLAGGRGFAISGTVSLGEGGVR